jgi:hypothetical protein
MKNLISENGISVELANLSHKFGLIVRPQDTETIDSVFTQLANYDESERAETFDYLKHALNETRASLGAEPAFRE